MVRLTRLFKSFIYAFRGLAKVIRTEQNFRIHMLFTLLVFLAGYFFQINLMEWALVILAIGLVILAEIVNSAVERVSDILKPRIHDYAKEIKDIMAAAVMTASLIAVIIGIIVFLPYLLDLFKLG